MKFDAMASAKVFGGSPAQTAKNIEILKGHLDDHDPFISIKYDGWRMFDLDGELKLRSLKPPKNLHTRKVFAELFNAARQAKFIGLDGEGIACAPEDPQCISKCHSAFNTIASEPVFDFYVFDLHGDADKPFEYRYAKSEEAVNYLNDLGFEFVKLAVHERVSEFETLMWRMDTLIDAGHEGIMGRHPRGLYKYGRSTMAQGWLWALKPYEDDEAEIIGFEEELENQNELTTNERGYASRAGLKENLVPKGRLGKFICRSPRFEETFSVGAGVGLTHALRQYVWDHREEFLGQWLKYKFQNVGIKDRPRQPKFMGFRAPEDMAYFKGRI